jgi:branched-chain amino acid transport system permease protein
MGTMRQLLGRTTPSNVFLWAGILLVLCFLPLCIPSFYVYFFAEVFIMVLFALSYNLMLGHSGMLSFGHAAFFGVGAYTYAILAKKALLPFGVALSAAPVVGLLASIIIGYFCVRHTRLYFAFLTFAFAQMIFVIIYRLPGLTGGDDGLISVPVTKWLTSATGAYYFILAVSALCLFLLLTITDSPFGTVLHAIRDNPEKARFSGLKVSRFRLASFIIAGFFGAVAGALYVILTKAAFIEFVGMEIGIIPLFACLLGGMHTFYGPVIGATLVISLDKLLGAYTQYWSAVTGVAVILIIIAFPKGILGFLKQKRVKDLNSMLKG